MPFIQVKNWRKFQHYRDGRTPTWIKLYVDLTKRYDRKGKKKFRPMPDSAKLTFLMILCEFAHFDGGIPYETDADLLELLGIFNVDLEPLIENDYIEITPEMVQDCTKLGQNGTDSSGKGTLEQDQDQDKDVDQEKDKEQKTKNGEVVGNNFSNSLVLGLRISEILDKEFPTKSKREATTFSNVARHLDRYGTERMAKGEDFMSTLAGWIKQAKGPSVKNPKAMFVQICKKKTGFAKAAKII